MSSTPEPRPRRQKSEKKKSGTTQSNLHVFHLEFIDTCLAAHKTWSSPPLSTLLELTISNVCCSSQSLFPSDDDAGGRANSLWAQLQATAHSTQSTRIRQSTDSECHLHIHLTLCLPSLDSGARERDSQGGAPTTSLDVGVGAHAQNSIHFPLPSAGSSGANSHPTIHPCLLTPPIPLCFTQKKPCPLLSDNVDQSSVIREFPVPGPKNAIISNRNNRIFLVGSQSPSQLSTSRMPLSPMRRTREESP
ncbi:hypothetical protein DL93DRAFT_1719539 [Clavulina sp. PMI_390]|nr:hypothetical protein DL93DRAFT_1719539 [Clavulina sp. PMI_390]